jgi:hypothetical protein
LREQRKTADIHIRNWKQNKNPPRMQDPCTYSPIVYFPHELQRAPRQHEMVKRVPNANDGPRHHRCFMAKEPPTPSLITRLFGQTTTNANTHEVMQVDQEENENYRNETSSERSISMSDTTENIWDLRRNLEAADLRQITPSARQEESVEDTEGDEIESQTSTRKKRNKNSSEKKN